MSFEKVGNKTLTTAAENFTQDDDFKNSEAGKALEAIRVRSQIQLKLKTGKELEVC